MGAIESGWCDALSHFTVNPLTEQVYARLKDDMFELRLLPGDRFSETELAERFEVSRMPLRDALYRLQREGYLEAESRRGWQVRALDFRYFADLFDLRIALETAALDCLCRRPDEPPQLAALRRTWLTGDPARTADARRVCELDEKFHASLVAAAGNAELVRVHAELTEKLRVLRRLDFTQQDRIGAACSEHAKIVQLLLRRDYADAAALLRMHIARTRDEVGRLTAQRLQQARAAR